MCLNLGSIRAAVDSERFFPLLLLPPGFCFTKQNSQDSQEHP